MRQQRKTKGKIVRNGLAGRRQSWNWKHANAAISLLYYRNISFLGILVEPLHLPSISQPCSRLYDPAESLYHHNIILLLSQCYHCTCLFCHPEAYDVPNQQQKCKFTTYGPSLATIDNN
jgi:hypothetical protein